MSEMIELEVARYALRTFALTLTVEDLDSETFGLDSVAIASGGWNRGVCTAECRAEPSYPPASPLFPHRFGLPEKVHLHEAPSLSCQCGIYGSLTARNLLCQYECARNLIAVMAAEGGTIIGSRGLRTQYARVVAYWCNPDASPTIEDYVRGTVLSGASPRRWYAAKMETTKKYRDALSQACVCDLPHARRYFDPQQMLADFHFREEDLLWLGSQLPILNSSFNIQHRAFSIGTTPAGRNWWTD